MYFVGVIYISSFSVFQAFWSLPSEVQTPKVVIVKVPYRLLFIPIQLTQLVHHYHTTVPIATPTAMVGHGADGEVAGTAVSMQGVTPGHVPQGGPRAASVCAADGRPPRGCAPQ